MSEASVPLRKALTAQEKGAIGILFVSDVHNHSEPENFEALARAAWPDKPPRIQHYTLHEWVDQVRIPAARISKALARTLLHRAPDLSLEKLAQRSEKPCDEAVVASSLPLVTLSTDVRQHVVHDRNVLAALEGSDPNLKNEWVIVSCHHDHEGADGDQVFNGADDNGSGTVGMLEIAEAYALAARDGHRPKRSILFAAFNSEERGLLGSWAFVERPPVPLDRIVAVLNMDMVGRNEEVPEGGGPRFRGLPVQSAESNQNSVNLLGYSRSASLCCNHRPCQRRNRPDSQEGPRQQQLQPPAQKRSMAVSPARRAGSLHPHGPAPRLPHAAAIGPRRSTTPRWSASSASCTRRAGNSPSNPAGRGWMRKPRHHDQVQPRKFR